MDQLKTWVNITDILWPVGSVYEGLTNSTNTPAKMFGGYWRVIKSNISSTNNNITYDIWYRYA